MSRDPSAAFQSAVAGRHLEQVVFAELQFASGTSRLCTRELDMDWNGSTWLGKGRVGSIEAIGEGAQLEARQIAMSLSGIPSGVLATALDPSEYKNRLAKLWFGLIEPDIVDFDFTQATLSAAVGAALAEITFTRSGATATRVNAAGLIETVAADTPRFGYDPMTLQCKGLPVEEARTNVVCHSEDLDTATVSNAGASGDWARCIGTTIAPDAAQAPDGQMTMDRVIEATGTANPHGVRQSFAVTAGQTYYLSWFAKAAERTRMSQWSFPSTVNGDTTSAIFDLAAGSVVSGTDSPEIEGYGDGVYRCRRRIDIIATGTLTIHVGPQDATATQMYNGNGASGVYIWGVQLELGAFPTSYIPTTAAAVTRNPDTALDTDISYFNPAEGTIFVEFIPNATTDATFRRVVSFNDGTTNEEMYIGVASGNVRVFVTDGGVTQASLNLGAYTPGEVNRVALRYGLNDIAASLNGGAVVTDTAATLPTVTRKALGSTGGGAFLNGHIRRDTYYPKRLSNAAIVRLSGGGDVLAEAVGQRIVSDPVGPFTYRMDSLEFEVGETNSVRLTAFARLEDWQRPRVRRYNDADQQQLHPGDRFFEYAEQMVNATLIW